MSDKSGTSSQIISFPISGDALKDIVEEFSPNFHTGTVNFTIPISAPPGRNGFETQLSLVCSNGNGNGHFVLGSSLSILGSAVRLQIQLVKIWR